MTIWGTMLYFFSFFLSYSFKFKFEKKRLGTITSSFSVILSPLLNADLSSSIKNKVVVTE